VLLPGQRHDSIGVEPLITGLDFEALIGDKAFDIHYVHCKHGYQNYQTRRSGHHREGDRGTSLTPSGRKMVEYRYSRLRLLRPLPRLAPSSALS
jgi:hypothetical protein